MIKYRFAEKRRIDLAKDLKIGFSEYDPDRMQAINIFKLDELDEMTKASSALIKEISLLKSDSEKSSKVVQFIAIAAELYNSVRLAMIIDLWRKEGRDKMLKTLQLPDIDYEERRKAE